MKIFFIRIILPLLLIVSTFFVTSCSEEETKPNPTSGLIKITEGYALGAGARVEVWAGQEFLAGYNKLFISLFDSTSGQRITDPHIHLNALMDMGTMTHGCPVEEPEPLAIDDLFPAGILFTMPSGDMGSWTLEVKVHNHLTGNRGKAIFEVDVASTAFPSAAVFQAPNGDKYYVGYHFENKLKVGVNEFEVVAFTMTEDEFVPADNLTINFSPEMPSMEHGSPNNISPVHIGNGHYAGKANFTMTGAWRLHLQFVNDTNTIGEKYFDVVVE